METSYPIIVVGMGPVGMTAALLLAQHGIQVACFEQYPHLPDIPRAIHLDDEVLRVFHVLGLGEELEKMVKEIPGMRILNSRGKLLLETKKSPSSAFPSSMLFQSPALERLLAAQIAQTPLIDSFWGTPVESIDQEKDSWKISVRHESVRKQVQAQYLIACDGTNSLVRQTLNIPWQSLGYRALHLKLDIISSQVDTYSDWIEKVCSPYQKARVFLNASGKHLRWEFILPAAQKETPSIEVLLAQHKGHIPDFHTLKLWHIARYYFQAGIAKTWKQGLLFLAGDAAHQMPPYIGQGMCAGIRDVYNLAWKLIFVYEGKSRPEILESYERERKPHVTFVTRIGIGVGYLFSRWPGYLLQGLAFFIPRSLRSITVPPLRMRTGLIAKGYPLAGQILPSGWFSYNGQRKSYDLLVQGRFSLLCISKAVQTTVLAEAQALLHQMEVKTFALDEDSLPEAAPHSFRSLMQMHKVEILLIRPDLYLYGACKQKNIQRLLRRWQADYCAT